MADSADSVVITGASSGIGRALALHYAAPGMTLGLVGRNEARLTDVAELCRRKGAAVTLGVIDVRDRDGLARGLLDFDAQHPVGLLVANAGVSGGTHTDGSREDGALAAAQIEINLLGVLNTVHPLLPLMMQRGRGQIALMSSIAAFVPLADSAGYGASKAAVLYYGLALREGIRVPGVKVNVICPGYVTSPMSARLKGWKPFEMPADRAAEKIALGLARNRAVIAFPWPLTLLSRIGGALPSGVRRFATRPFGFTIAPPRGDRI